MPNTTTKCRDIDTRSIDLLMGLLTQLRVSTDCSEDIEGIVQLLSIDLNYEECMASASSLANAMENLYRLKDAKAILLLLCSLLETKVTDLQGRIGPASLHHGITSLPNEILAKILLEASGMDHGCKSRSKTLTILSSVCKRFRDLMHDCAKFWTRICTCCSKCREGWLEKQLRLSKNALLHVNTEFQCEDFIKFMHMALPHQKRWSSLKLSVDASELQDLVERHPKTVFSSMIHLEAFFAVEDTQQTCCSWLFANWSFPNLQTLDLHGAIPCFIHFSNLTEARLSSFRTEDENLHETFLQKVLLFLQQTPCLEKLMVDISYVFCSEELAESVVILQHLVSFHLTSTLFHEDVEDIEFPCPLITIKQFVQALQTPNLEAFSLAIAVEESPGVSCVNFILPPSFSCSSIKKFSLEIASLEAEFPGPAIHAEDLFRRFPSLTDLVLEVQFATLVLAASGVREQMKCLRSLSIVDFEIDYWDVCRLLDMLYEAGIILLELKIAPQRYFAKRDLQEKYPGTEITVQENTSHTIKTRWW